MAFESLSFRHILKLSDFPERWLPLVFLYDPDLPLFPVYYFHVLPDKWVPGQRPGYSDRAFGYVERVNLDNSGDLEVHIICNKDLNHHSNTAYLSAVTQAVRVGLVFPILLFSPILRMRSQVQWFTQIKSWSRFWHRVVSDAYGNCLPFGSLWDP